MVEPYLTKFQTDKPMIPFMYYELKSVIQNLLEIIVKSSVLEESKNVPQKWKEIDLNDEKNLIPAEKLKLGLAVENEINCLKKRDLVTSREKNKFLSEVQDFLVAMINKLFEKSPVCSIFLKAASVLDPDVIFNNKKDDLVNRFRILLKSIIKLAILPANKCDQALTDFKKFVDLVKSSAHTFSQKDDRLDDYYFNSQFNISKYEEFSFIVQLVLTLSHGQATVERGFNLTKSLLQTNMTPETVISKRLIRDHMIANEISPHSIDVSGPLIKEFRSAHQKYVIHLKDAKEKAEKSDNERKSRLIADDIEKLKSKQISLTKSINLMETEVNECMESGENQMEIKCFIKANTLKKKSTVLQAQVKSLDDEIEQLQIKRQKLN